MSKSSGRLAKAHNDLMDWSEWCIRHMDTSSVGYANRTVEGRAMRGGIGVQRSGYFSSRCPDVMMRANVRRVDRAIRAMVWSVRVAALCKYYPEMAEHDALIKVRHKGQWTDGDKMRLFKYITGLQVNDYYARWMIAKECVAEGRR